MYMQKKAPFPGANCPSMASMANTAATVEKGRWIDGHNLALFQPLLRASLTLVNNPPFLTRLMLAGRQRTENHDCLERGVGVSLEPPGEYMDVSLNLRSVLVGGYGRHLGSELRILSIWGTTLQGFGNFRVDWGERQHNYCHVGQGDLRSSWADPWECRFPFPSCFGSTCSRDRVCT
jgi:hypothetical protein